MDDEICSRTVVVVQQVATTITASVPLLVRLSERLFRTGALEGSYSTRSEECGFLLDTTKAH